MCTSSEATPPKECCSAAAECCAPLGSGIGGLVTCGSNSNFLPTGPRSTVAPPSLNDGKWIWTREAAPFPTASPPIGGRPFLKTFQLPEFVDSATIDVMCDDVCTVYVDGFAVGSMGLADPRRYSFRLPRTTRCPTVVFYGMQVGGGPAGVVASGVFWNSLSPEPKRYLFATDGSWRCLSYEPGPDFGYLPAACMPWEGVYVEGAFGVAPWGNKVPTSNSPGSPPARNVPGNLDAPAAPQLPVMT